MWKYQDYHFSKCHFVTSDMFSQIVISSHISPKAPIFVRNMWQPTCFPRSHHIFVRKISLHIPPKALIFVRNMRQPAWFTRLHHIFVRKISSHISPKALIFLRNMLQPTCFPRLHHIFLRKISALGWKIMHFRWKLVILTPCIYFSHFQVSSQRVASTRCISCQKRESLTGFSATWWTDVCQVHEVWISHILWKWALLPT